MWLSFDALSPMWFSVLLPIGAYGHPDHIAICQFTTAAVTCAATGLPHPDYPTPDRVSKLYYLAWCADKWAAYQAVLRKLVIVVEWSGAAGDTLAYWAC